VFLVLPHCSIIAGFTSRTSPSCHNRQFKNWSFRIFVDGNDEFGGLNTHMVLNGPEIPQAKVDLGVHVVPSVLSDGNGSTKPASMAALEAPTTPPRFGQFYDHLKSNAFPFLFPPNTMELLRETISLAFGPLPHFSINICFGQ
jgi:hypothetical protein